jgi:hypothetical protein
MNGGNIQGARVRSERWPVYNMYFPVYTIDLYLLELRVKELAIGGSVLGVVFVAKFPSALARLRDLSLQLTYIGA